MRLVILFVACLLVEGISPTVVNWAHLSNAQDQLVWFALCYSVFFDVAHLIKHK